MRADWEVASCGGLVTPAAEEHGWEVFVYDEAKIFKYDDVLNAPCMISGGASALSTRAIAPSAFPRQRGTEREKCRLATLRRA